MNELLNQAWKLVFFKISLKNFYLLIETHLFSKPATRHKSPHVVASIQRFNRFSFWVPTVILSFESLRERSQAFTKFIEVAKVCLPFFQTIPFTFYLMLTLSYLFSSPLIYSRN